jgi:hypothetical protein
MEPLRADAGRKMKRELGVVVKDDGVTIYPTAPYPPYYAPPHAWMHVQV